MAIDFVRIFDAAPTPFILVDRDFRIIWMNRAYLSVTRRGAEDLAGRVLTEAFPVAPGSLPDQLLRSSLLRAHDTGEVDHLPLIPYPIAGDDGQIRDTQWSATHTPIRDATGEVAHILQNTVEITGLGRQAGTNSHADMLDRSAEILRRNIVLGSQLRNLRETFERAPTFIAMMTGPEHVFQIVNDAYLQLIGHRELIGLTVREALPEIVGQGHYELLDTAYRTGEPFLARAAPVTLRRRRGGGAGGAVHRLHLPAHAAGRWQRHRHLHSGP